MTDAWKRRIMLNAFLLLICLVFALKVYDVRLTEPANIKVGLSTINCGFRELLHYKGTSDYSKLLFAIVLILGAVSIIAAIFWLALFIKDWLNNRGGEGVGMDKNLMATFFLYLFTGLICLVFKGFPVNKGPVLFPGGNSTFYSFPALPPVIILIAMGSTMYHLAERFEDKKRQLRISFIICISIMVLGTLAALFSGVYWLTDIIGALLFCTAQIFLYSFFFYV